MKRLIGFVFAAAAVAWGCSKDDMSQNFVFLSDEAPESLTKTDIEKVATLNSFSLKLTGEISKLQENKSFAYSPTSIGYALGLLAEGAVGQPRDEIVSALGFGAGDQRGMDEFFRNLIVLSTSSSSPDAMMEIANVVLTDGTYSVKNSFKKAIKRYYDADLIEGNLNAGFINKWVSTHTRGLIKNFIDGNEISGSRAAFLNTLYFKGTWADGFSKSATVKRVFNNPVTGAREIDFMNKLALGSPAVRYSERSDSQWLMCDFGGGDNESCNYSMVFTLPLEGKTPESVISSMTSKQWEQQMSSFKSQNIDIKLPKYEVSTVSSKIVEALSALGVNHIFSGASLENFSDAELFATTIKHAARLSVDENGSEAAAATIIDDATASPDEEAPHYVSFYAERPFIFTIVEKRTGAILFQGIYK